MNYFSHYFLDKDRTDSLFFVGVMTPDLISTFNRSRRLKAGRLPIVIEHEATEEQLSFYNGVLRHFEVDDVFHNSDFFHRETRLITHTLKEGFGKEHIPRAFFISHILFELMLDRILIKQHSSLLYAFYRHFQEKDIQLLVQLTEWVACQPLPGYDHFLKRFGEVRFLYRYADWDFILEVMRMVMDKVNISRLDFLFSDKFLVLMQKYEEGLRRRLPRALNQLASELSNKVSYSAE
ncbi:MAG: hypothetical protein D6730_13330 [Bacteroidetes bacterium]|nr:MAG: hypothetical protein D6730_13330 [Bacteroidota bacterium]